MLGELQENFSRMCHNPKHAMLCILLLKCFLRPDIPDCVALIGNQKSDHRLTDTLGHLLTPLGLGGVTAVAGEQALA